MKVLYLVLLLLSAVCFAVAAFTRRDTLDGRSISLIPLGLLFWVLVPLLQTLQSVDD